MYWRGICDWIAIATLVKPPRDAAGPLRECLEDRERPEALCEALWPSRRLCGFPVLLLPAALGLVVGGWAGGALGELGAMGRHWGQWGGTGVRGELGELGAGLGSWGQCGGGIGGVALNWGQCAGALGGLG